METTQDAFKRNLRRIRESLGLTQESMALKLGIQLSHYRKFEYGESWPSTKKMNEYAQKLNIEPFEFAKPDPSVPAAQTLSELASIGPKKLGDMTPEEFESWDANRRQKLSQIEPIPITQKINHGTIENLKLQIETLTREYNEQKRQIKKLEKQLPTKKQRDLLGRIESAQPIRQKIIEAVIYNNPTLIRSMSPDVIQAFQLLSKAR